MLFTMANVPILGISEDAIAGVLGWELNRAEKTWDQLLPQGFLSQVSTKDVALNFMI